MDAFVLGNMNAPWLGVSGRTCAVRPRRAGVNSQVPDLVAAITTLIIYTSQPGVSRASGATAEPTFPAG